VGVTAVVQDGQANSRFLVGVHRAPVAISRIHRSALYPDLPTMDEAGIKGFDLMLGPGSSRPPERRRRW
jgi:hypothetical protein